MHDAVRIGASSILGQGRGGDVARQSEPAAFEQALGGKRQHFGWGYSGRAGARDH